MRTAETSCIFITGAFIYWAIELLWQGFTHWTMPITGGLCFILIYAIANFMSTPLWQKWLMSASCITAIEFVIGSVINIHLGWDVWDYSWQPYNLYGQISLNFFGLWLMLSVPAVLLSNILRYFVFIPLYREGKHSP